MKKYLICLFILTVLFGLSCASAPTTPTPTTPQYAPPPATTPPPSTTTTPTPPPPPPPAPLVLLSAAGLDMAGAVDYTVIPGDFLSEITRSFYGHLNDVGPAGTRNGFYYPLLMLASEGLIEDPDLIFSGTILKIPNLENNLANPDSRRAIKNILTQVALLYRNKYMPDEEEGLLRLADFL